MARYRVLSPDGFDIECCSNYRSKKQAMEALTRFCARYEAQGYYSTMSRSRIPVWDIANYCEVLPI